MDDEQIIELYVARDERAISETDGKYGRYCGSLAKQILSDPLDAEEVVSDTWLKAWGSIPPTRPGVLKLFLAKIVRNLSYSRWRAQTAQKRGGGEIDVALEELGECAGPDRDAGSELEAKELADAIGRFLETVSERDRNIFLRRYFFVDSVAQIAERSSVRESNVHMILSRVRRKLKEFLIKEELL
ncbi:MAG: RNA polymerase sigma factor [Oscillospiraceae bacterium]|nr:RNA polymerase sigma factor [Oscillospiraceae bacterium]